MFVISYILSGAPLPKKMLAPTPPMGWDSWYAFSTGINETLIHSIADTLVSSGLRDAGYNNIIIDDGYLLSTRNGRSLQIDTKKFPLGMRNLGDYMHQRSMNFGIYEAAGTTTTKGNPGSFGYESDDASTFASWGVDYLKYVFQNNPIVNQIWAPDFGDLMLNGQLYSIQNADLVDTTINDQGFAGYIGNNTGEVVFYVDAPYAGQFQASIKYVDSDGYRMFKVSTNGGYPDTYVNFQKTSSMKKGDAKDFYFGLTLNLGENKIRIYFDNKAKENCDYSYQRMTDQVILAGRDTIISIFDAENYNPWEWAAELGHTWMTTYAEDNCSFDNVVSMYDENVGLDSYAAANGFNDANKLCIGLNTSLTKVQQISQMSLWSIMMAPLILSDDIRNLNADSKSIAMNMDSIAINQDSLTIQGMRIQAGNNQHVIVKPLQNGSVAVVFFNRNGKNQQTIQYSMKKLSQYIEIQNASIWNNAISYNCMEIWSATLTSTQDYLVGMNIEAYGARLYVVTPQQ